MSIRLALVLLALAPTAALAAVPVFGEPGVTTGPAVDVPEVWLSTWERGCYERAADPDAHFGRAITQVTSTSDPATGRYYAIGPMAGSLDVIIPYTIGVQASDCLGNYFEAKPLFVVHNLAERPGGSEIRVYDGPFQVCFRSGISAAEHYLACYDPNAATPTETRWLHDDDLTAQLAPMGSDDPAIDPSWPPGLPDMETPTRVGWKRGETMLVHGHAVARVSLGFAAYVGGPTVGSVAWLVEQAPDGTIDVRAGPLPLGQNGVGAPGPLNQGSFLYWDATTDSAVMRYPVQHIGEDPSQPSIAFRVPGLAYFPLAPAVRGLGVLDLARVMYEQERIYNDGDGRLFVANTHQDRPLLIDPSLVDFDDDGLSTTQEAAAGTSVFDADSDGGGLGDGLEVDIYGSDPNVIDDLEPATFDPDDTYTYSQLVRERLPEVKEIDRVSYPTPYVCSEGRCFDAAGKRVFEVSGVGALPIALVTPEGDAVLWRDAAYWYRHDLVSGEDTRLVRIIEAQALIGSAPEWVTPGVDGRIYLGGNTVVVMAEPDAAPAVIFDLAVVDPGHSGRLWLDGYDPGIDGLFITAEGEDDDNVILVSPEHAPHVALRGYDFPSFIVRPDELTVTGRGDYELSFAYYLSHNAGDDATAGTALVGAGLRSGVDLVDGGVTPDAISGGWGDSLFTNEGISTRTPVELVRARRELRPGDLVGWLYNLPQAREGQRLARIPPRGGAVPLVAAGDALAASAAHYQEIDGIGAASDGRICLAVHHAGDGTSPLVELSAPNDAGVPTQSTDIAWAIDAEDCAYDASGALHYLGALPSAVWSVPTHTSIELPMVRHPQHLVARPDGGFIVTGIDDFVEPLENTKASPLVCIDADGTVRTNELFHPVAATFAQSGDLYFIERGDSTLYRMEAASGVLDPCGTDRYLYRTGFSVQTLIDEWALYVGSEFAPGSQMLAGTLSERPDGRLALIIGLHTKLAGVEGHIRVHAIDRADWSYVLLAQDQMTAVARVPGLADWCDPWADVLPAGSDPICPEDGPSSLELSPGQTGEVEPDPEPEPEPEIDEDTGSPTTATTSEEDTGTPPKDKSKDDGCNGGSPTLPLALALALTLALTRARARLRTRIHNHQRAR